MNNVLFHQAAKLRYESLSCISLRRRGIVCPAEWRPRKRNIGHGCVLLPLKVSGRDPEQDRGADFTQSFRKHSIKPSTAGEVTNYSFAPQLQEIVGCLRSGIRSSLLAILISDVNG
jgi:hypothetical protein